MGYFYVLREIKRIVGSFFATLVSVIACITLALRPYIALRRSGTIESMRVQRAFSAWSRTVCFALRTFVGTKFDLLDLDTLVREQVGRLAIARGGDPQCVVLVVRHMSTLDIHAIRAAAKETPVIFVTAAFIRNIKGFGDLVEAAGMVSLTEKGGQKTLPLKKLKKNVLQFNTRGFVPLVVVFPTGTRRDTDDSLSPVLDGAAAIAFFLRLNSIVAVQLRGTGEVWPACDDTTWGRIASELPFCTLRNGRVCLTDPNVIRVPEKAHEKPKKEKQLREIRDQIAKCI